MPHAFVSYVRDDTAAVDTLVADLRRAGVEVWLDRDAIRVGTRWEQSIADAVAGGAFFVACFSRAYLAREKTYMHEELALARQLLAAGEPGGGIGHDWCLPVLLDALAPRDVPALATPEFAPLQAVAMSPDWQDGLRRLLETLSPAHAFGRRLNELPPRAGTAMAAGAAPILALDFGTSYSLLAYQDAAGAWQAIAGPEGRVLHPSAVAFADNWDYWVGAPALGLAAQRPDRVAQHFKRLLGSGEAVAIGHKRFDAVSLAALVIRWLRDCAEAHLGLAVRDVMTAMPADFSWAQTAALVAACEQAGLRVLRLIPESNAAGVLAMDWFRGRVGSGPPLNVVNGSATTLVVDMGGGTTDVSLVETSDVEGEDLVRVLAAAGDNELGGLDYDAAVADALQRSCVAPARARGVVWTALDDRRLMQIARQAKETLSHTERWEGVIDGLETRGGAFIVLPLHLDRAELATATQALDARFTALIQRLFSDPRSASGDLQAVMLAGQGSRAWTVANLLRRLYPAVQWIEAFQENAVARGLGSYSRVLDGRHRSLLLMDVLTRPMLLRHVGRLIYDKERLETPRYQVAGRVDVNKEFATLLEAGSVLPARGAIAIVAVGVENGFVIEIVQGQHDGSPGQAIVRLEASDVKRGTEMLVEADAAAQGDVRWRLTHRGTGALLAEQRTAIVDEQLWSKRVLDDTLARVRRPDSLSPLHRKSEP